MSALKMHEEDLKYSFENGHSCGDEIDLGEFQNYILDQIDIERLVARWRCHTFIRGRCYIEHVTHPLLREAHLS